MRVATWLPNITCCHQRLQGTGTSRKVAEDSQVCNVGYDNMQCAPPTALRKVP